MSEESSHGHPKQRGGIHRAMAATVRSAKKTGRLLRLGFFMLVFCAVCALPIAVTVSERAFSMFASIASVLIDGADLLSLERKKTASVSADLKQSQEYNSLREKQIKSQNQQISGQKTKLSKLEVEAKAGSKRVRELTAQIDDMKARPAKTRVKLGGKIMFAGDAIRVTRSRVDDRLARSIAKEIASLGAEAIPYVGVAVLIAFLVDDVKQSCAAVQDIQDLENAFTGLEEAASAKVCALEDKIPSPESVWNGMVSAPVAVYSFAKESLPEFHWQAGWDDMVEKVGGVIDYLSGWIGVPEN